MTGTSTTGRRHCTRIAATALPLYLTMVASSAGALVDTALLGRHATSSLAAFAVTIAVYSPATAAVTGTLRGVMPFVSRHEDDPDIMVPLVRNGMWLGFIVGLLGALAVAWARVIGRATGVPESTLDRLGAFPCLLAIAVLSTSVGASAISVLVALGQGKLVMRAGLTGTAVAVLMSIALIAGVGPVPALGLNGAGIAMLASSLVTTCRVQLALHRLPVLAGRSLRPGRPDLPRVFRLAGVGVPLAGTVLIKFVVLGVLTFAAARLGTEQAAVHGVSETLVNLVYTLAVAIGQATVPIVAGAARDADVAEARRSVVAGGGVALCGVGTLGIGLVVFGHWIVPLLSNDPSLRPQLEDQLPLVLAVVVTDALQAIAGFGMLGLKRTFPSLVSTAVFFGLLCLSAVPVADAGGLTALWSALICANLLQALTKAAAFHRRSGRLATQQSGLTT
ncbi:MATE family efflux transporter (plasmid) [Streptomyces sp. NBC_01590]|uniref:MATE family efflux transporter n=1 Tax=Streptomyces sp. NBC_01590 TaxID=2975887 RepID=UPI002F913187